MTEVLMTKDTTWMAKRSMSPREVERTVKALGLTQAAVARFIGRSERTLRRYILGDAEMRPAEVLLLRACLEEGWEPIIPPWTPGSN
jgi:hypothetical protein